MFLIQSPGLSHQDPRICSIQAMAEAWVLPQDCLSVSHSCDPGLKRSPVICSFNISPLSTTTQRGKTKPQRFLPLKVPFSVSGREHHLNLLRKETKNVFIKQYNANISSFFLHKASENRIVEFSLRDCLPHPLPTKSNVSKCRECILLSPFQT